MNILNEQIRHTLYGDGKVIFHEEGVLSIQFSEQYGIKKFIYPDAFEKYLKLNNSDIEVFVLKELNDKKAWIEEEKLRKLQEYEDTVNAMKKSKPAAPKKRSTKKAKTQSENVEEI